MVQDGGGTPTQTDSSAIISLVLGIAGIFVLPLILSIPAIIIGKKSEQTIAESGGTLSGAELAKAGIITGWIGVGLAAAGIVVAILVLLFFVIAGSAMSF